MSTILISLDSDIDAMEKRLSRFGEKLRNTVVRRSLSRTATTARKQAIVSMREEYKLNLSQKEMKKFVQLKVGKGANLEATISVKGKPLPLYAFDPSVYGGPSGWPKRGRHKEGGVRVKVKGKKIEVPHAFIAKMKSGHVGVFARGGWSSVAGGTKRFGNFTYSNKRLPIQELKTFSYPQAFVHKAVSTEVMKVIHIKFPKELEHQIEFAWLKLKK